jgi:hypothetical protein
MSSSITKNDVFKSSRGSFDRLNNENYPQWSASMMRLLKAEGLWKIVTGDEICPVITGEHDGMTPEAAQNYQKRKVEDYRKQQDEASVLLHNACCVSTRVHIGKLEDPQTIWDTLKTRLDSAASDTGRQTLKTRLYAMQPATGESIAVWFEKLLHIRDQLAGSTEAIDDAQLRSVILNNIPVVYETTLKIEISKGKDVSIETIMDAVKEDESRRALRNKPPAATDAFLARELTDTKDVDNKDDKNTKDYRDSKEYRDFKEFKEARESREYREFRDYRNPRNDREFRNRPIQGKWCSFCESNTHTYAACYRRPRSDNRDNYSGFNTGQKRTFSSFECFHCGEQGHRSDNCPAKRRGEEARFKRNRQIEDRRQSALVTSEPSTGNAAMTTTNTGNSDRDAGPGF